MLERLNGWSSNAVKLNPVGSRSGIAPSSLIEVELPQNCLVQLSSLAMNFRVSYAGTTTCIPPRWFPQTMIRRIECQVNGITLSAGSNNYGTVYNMLGEITTPEDFCRFTSLQMGGMPSGTEPVLVTNLALNAASAAVAAENHDHRPYMSAQNWIGFLGSQQWLNTALLGSVRIRIQLDSNAVMSQHENNGDASYTLDDLDFTVMVASLDDGLYQQALLERLAGGGQVSYPFKSYYTYEQQNTGGSASVKGTLSSSSVDRVTGLIRASNYSTKAVTAAQLTTYLGGTTPYFTACGGGSYTAAGQSDNLVGLDAARTTAELLSWQFLINSNYSPNYLVQCANREFSKGGLSAIETRRSYGTQNDTTSGDLLNYTASHIYPYTTAAAGGPALTGPNVGGGVGGVVNRARSDAQQRAYKNYHCYCSVPLEYVSGSDRLVSGSNFRGSVGVIFWNIETSADNNNTMLVVEVTSVLKIGAGGAAELIV
jgi:hypothetical protein